MSSLRVATLNIWGRQGPWEERRAVIRAHLAALDVDLLGLQEVLRFDAERAPYAAERAAPQPTSDQAMELAEGLGYHTAFGPALDLGYGFSFGNAILSRHPLTDVQNLALPTTPGIEPRALLTTKAQTPDGPILFCSTHLSWRFDEGAVRARQVVAIAAALDRRAAELEYPAILVGDFNAVAESDEIRFLRGLHVRDGVSTYFIDAFAEVGEGAGATFCRANDFARPNDEPDRRIDYIFVRGRDPRRWGRPRRCALAFDRPLPPAPGAPPCFASDHFGVLAELRGIAAEGNG